jgi:hypothetical protein
VTNLPESRHPSPDCADKRAVGKADAEFPLSHGDKLDVAFHAVVTLACAAAQTVTVAEVGCRGIENAATKRDRMLATGWV